MRTTSLFGLVCLLLAPIAGATTPPKPVFEPIGSYDTGLGLTAAEIVAYEGGRAFVVNAVANSLDVVSLADPTAPVLERRIELSVYGAGVNSVDVKNGIVAVAVQANPSTDPGKVVLLDVAGNLLDQATVGALPDMLTFTPDGLRVVVANEGEPADDYSVDPEGSVSILTILPIGPRKGRVLSNRTVRFTDFNAGGPRASQLDSRVRVYGPGSSVAQDLEPEYVAISPNLITAWVTLQEANAIARIDLLRARVESILPLGTKDHSLAGAGLDPSDRDSAIAIANWPVRGMYQPDAIASFFALGRVHWITANEGDSRAYSALNEEVRVGSSSYPLDPTVFPNASALKANSALGRLTVTNRSGDTDGDGDFDEIHVFGARSFSIWGNDGKLVYDSGDALEQITAAALPANFNSNNDANDFDSRSDNKGPEPEAVTVGRVGWRQYAFVGLERIGGLAIYDVTDPRAPSFVQYTNNRDFSRSPVGPDSGPEGVKLVPAAHSPTGRALLLVANEISGTMTVYEARDPADAD